MVRLIAIAALCCAGCVPTNNAPPAGTYTPSLAHALALPADAAPTPPAPDPGKCQNCGGDGELGDGTIKVPCPVCRPKAPEPPKVIIKEAPVEKIVEKIVYVEKPQVPLPCKCVPECQCKSGECGCDMKAKPAALTVPFAEPAAEDCPPGGWGTSSGRSSASEGQPRRFRLFGRRR